MNEWSSDTRPNYLTARRVNQNRISFFQACDFPLGSFTRLVKGFPYRRKPRPDICRLYRSVANHASPDFSRVRICWRPSRVAESDSVSCAAIDRVSSQTSLSNSFDHRADRVGLDEPLRRYGLRSLPTDPIAKHCPYDDFFRGTFAPFLRASDNPIAIACFRLFTRPPLPPLPDFSVPFFSRRTALSTLLPAAFPYRAIVDLLNCSASYRHPHRHPPYSLWSRTGIQDGVVRRSSQDPPPANAASQRLVRHVTIQVRLTCPGRPTYYSPPCPVMPV